MPSLSARTKYFLSGQKVFFPQLKSHILSFSKENMYFFSLGQKCLSRQKIFCPGRWIRHLSCFSLFKINQNQKMERSFNQRLCFITSRDGFGKRDKEVAMWYKLFIFLTQKSRKCQDCYHHYNCGQLRFCSTMISQQHQFF